MNNSEAKKRMFKSSASGKYIANKKADYKPKQFKVIYKEDIKLYNPNVVSKKRRIISA
ncbi:MAG: hypothetical protein AAB914_00775 [Patescibacteria group bacterium]